METLRMSSEERKRLVVFSRVQREELSLAKAGELLGVSYGPKTGFVGSG